MFPLVPPFFLAFPPLPCLVESCVKGSNQQPTEFFFNLGSRSEEASECGVMFLSTVQDKVNVGDGTARGSAGWSRRMGMDETFT